MKRKFGLVLIAGMVTYLVNALCGVAEEELYFDYMFSNFGLIALPSAQVSNPSRKELTDLTTDTGTAARVSAYAGDTLQEKQERVCAPAAAAMRRSTRFTISWCTGYKIFLT